MWGLFKKKTPPPTPVSANPTVDTVPAIPAVPVAETPSIVATEPTTSAAAVTQPEKKGWLDKLKSGLSATRNKLGLNVLFAGKLDEETLEQLEA